MKYLNDKIRYDMIWWNNEVFKWWYNMMWYDIVWEDMIWYDIRYIIRYDIVW